MQTKKIWDIERVEEIAGDDRELLGELCYLFLEDTEDRLRNMVSALRTGETTVIRNEAHAIKGAAANFGAQRMQEVAKYLERAAQGSETAGCARVLQALVGEFKALKSEIQRLSSES